MTPEGKSPNPFNTPAARVLRIVLACMYLVMGIVFIYTSLYISVNQPQTLQLMGGLIIGFGIYRLVRAIRSGGSSTIG